LVNYSVKTLAPSPVPLCRLLVKLFDHHNYVILAETIAISAWCFVGHGEKVGKSADGEDTEATRTACHVRNISLQGRQGSRESSKYKQ